MAEIPASPAPAPGVHAYRLTVHDAVGGRPWHAELRDEAAPADAPPLDFDTPLALARHLAHAGDPPGRPPDRGLR